MGSPPAPQCFLTLNPPSPPPPPPPPVAAAVRDGNVVRLNASTASAAAVSLPSLQQPDLRKLQPLPLSSIKIEIEPDLKKLTPVPITEKELSDGQAARPLPILVTNVVEHDGLPLPHVPALQALVDPVSTCGPTLPSSVPVSFTAPTGMELGDLSYDGHHDQDSHMMAALVKDYASNDEEIRVVLLDEGNGLLDQSEDPCLNDGNRNGGGVSIAASRGLADSPFGDEESVQKWLEICEA